MSFIRLLALSYLAWAAVFVVAVVLVAHLPLPGNAVGGTHAPAARTATVSAAPPADKPDARKVARLELAPVPPIPSPPAMDDVTPPEPPAAQAEPKPDLSKQSPPVAVAVKPASPRPPAARPEPRAVARLDLAPAAPVPVARPHKDVAPPKPHVVNEPWHKLALTEKPRPRPVAALPPAPAQARGLTHLASAKPAFRIPDPPPSSLSNLPVHLQPTGPQNGKRASAGFHIPDPPPLEPGRL